MIEEYLSDVKKRALTVSTGTGTNVDHKLSYKSLPPVHGVEAEKNIQDSTLLNLSESLIKSVIKQVKKEKHVLIHYSSILLMLKMPIKTRVMNSSLQMIQVRMNSSYDRI